MSGGKVSTLTEDPARVSLRTSSTGAVRRSAPGRNSRPRIKFLIASLVIVAAIGYMIYAAIESGSEYYATTSELAAMGDKAIGQQTKIGGEVVDGSVQWDRGANIVSFTLTDGTTILPVTYTGTVPDTFQPGNGVILEGKLGTDGGFQANTVLAKCASKYEPK
jgi:cytochrome c-type biogenesis protein CcmE